MAVVPKMAPGGVLVLDNANLYVDYRTRSPNSRYGRGHAGAEWTRFMDLVAAWRMVWTSNGVWDTAMWIKAG